MSCAVGWQMVLVSTGRPKHIMMARGGTCNIVLVDIDCTFRGQSKTIADMAMREH